jgi:hypothetical protein
MKECWKGYKSADMFQKLGNVYYFNALEQSAKWYELFAMTSDIDSLLPLYSIFESYRWKWQNKWNKKFHQLSGDDPEEIFS